MRGLLESAVVLRELACVSESRRIEILIGWILNELVSLERALSKTADSDPDVATEFAALEKRRAKLEDYARRHGVPVRTWRPNVENLATMRGLLEPGTDYWFTHQFVHGSTFALTQRYRASPGGLIEVGGQALLTERWAARSVLWAGDLAISAAADLTTILGWETPNELGDLRAQGLALLDTDEDEAASSR